MVPVLMDWWHQAYATSSVAQGCLWDNDNLVAENNRACGCFAQERQSMQAFLRVRIVVWFCGAPSLISECHIILSSTSSLERSNGHLHDPAWPHLTISSWNRLCNTFSCSIKSTSRSFIAIVCWCQWEQHPLFCSDYQSQDQWAKINTLCWIRWESCFRQY